MVCRSSGPVDGGGIIGTSYIPVYLGRAYVVLGRHLNLDFW